MKGGDFERDTAKKLSLWFSDNKRDDLVCRTDSSGGRGTIRSKKNLESNIYLFGDLKHSDDHVKPLFDIWCVELKTGYKLNKRKKGITRWDVLDLIDSGQKECVIHSFWNQCVFESENSSREPILIFRRNNRTACIMITQKYFRNLKKVYGQAGVYGIHFYLPSMFEPVNEVIIFPLDRFLQWITPAKKLFLTLKG